jgi:Flp pilus assembly pilin Flp
MLKRLIRDCEGQNIVEYGLLAAIVALGAVTALNSFQNIIKNVWAALSNNLAGS